MTNAVCPSCWRDRNPDRPAVAAPMQDRAVPCCFCGRLTAAGIYVNHEDLIAALRSEIERLREKLHRMAQLARLRP